MTQIIRDQIVSKKNAAISATYGLVPPQSKQAEEAVIAACLLESDIFSRVAATIPHEDCFYFIAHSLIYKSMIDLSNAGRKIDLITVTDDLNRKGKIEDAGGVYGITNLTMAVVSTAHVEDHAKLVMEKYHARELIRVSGEAISAAYNESDDIYMLIEQAKYNLKGISDGIESGGDMPIGKVFTEVLTELEYQKNHKSALTGVDTGLYALNEITCGWQKSDLIILAARPAKGKTALSLNLGLSAAISSLVEKVPVGIFSLEMPSIQLVKRMSSTVTGIDFKKIMSGNITDDEFNKIAEKSRYFHMLPIHIADKVFSLPNIVTKSRKWKEKHNIGLLIIDYLQLVKTIRKQGGNREQEIAGITGDLKALAKELEIPVILLAQLNRNVESRSTPEPIMADLRESGAIEQDADIIIFPWHTVDESFISIAKHRNGQTAVGEHALKIKFAGSIQKWMEPSAFEPFKQQYIPENARAGIVNNYQKIKDPDEETPF